MAQKTSQKDIALLVHDRAERPSNIVPGRVVGLVVQVVLDGLAQLVVLLPRWDWWVRPWRREIVAVHANASPMRDSVGFVRYGSMAE
jgi:hypothetical protein